MVTRPRRDRGKSQGLWCLLHATDGVVCYGSVCPQQCWKPAVPLRFGLVRTRCVSSKWCEPCGTAGFVCNFHCV